MLCVIWLNCSMGFKMMLLYSSRIDIYRYIGLSYCHIVKLRLADKLKGFVSIKTQENKNEK